MLTVLNVQVHVGTANSPLWIHEEHCKENALTSCYMYVFTTTGNTSVCAGYDEVTASQTVHCSTCLHTKLQVNMHGCTLSVHKCTINEIFKVASTFKMLVYKGAYVQDI